MKAAFSLLFAALSAGGGFGASAASPSYASSSSSLSSAFVSSVREDHREIHLAQDEAFGAPFVLVGGNHEHGSGNESEIQIEIQIETEVENESGPVDVAASSLLDRLSQMPFLLRRRPKRKLSRHQFNSRSNSNLNSNDPLRPLDVHSHSRPHRSLAFGDFADPTFSCPATTTCPVVCVASLADCPADALCPGTRPDDGTSTASSSNSRQYELCADGSCADLTAGQTCDPAAESPCECKALPFACAKQIDLYPNCMDVRFGEFYDANALCLEEQEDALEQVDFSGPWFLTCYVGIACITAAMLAWCAWNQRWSRVEGSVVELETAVGLARDSATVGAQRRAAKEEGDEPADPAECEKGNVREEATENALSSRTKSTESRVSASASLPPHETWTQTGYKSTLVGTALYSLVVLVHLVIQFLLLFLTIQYYVQQEAITRLGPPVFQDEIQVLMAFEITWMVGFVWCFFLKYPSSIRSLFLRRCLHDEATYVAVAAPVQTVDTHYQNKRIVKFLLVLGNAFRSVLSFLYSDLSHHDPSAGGTTTRKVTFCKIRIDEATGAKHFYFRMRRYVYSEEQRRYVPGSWDVTDGATIGSWLDDAYAHRGLSKEEASRRWGTVGPNVLDLKKPTPIGSIIQEFSKPFYLYQNFMVWTWAPFWYYYMAIVNTVVRLTGGFVVAFFQYGSDLDLYRLMVMEGTADVVREGNVVTVDQTDVVPGDIVRLRPGAAYFDMCIIQSKRVLVDESALTGEVHPIAKIPLDPADSHRTYHPKTHKSSTISAGTTILECGEGQTIEDADLAIVTQTGSFTAKGELLCDVLSYERHKFKFDTEVQLILFILCVEAAVMLSVVFSVLKDHWCYSWFYAMFVVGTVLPPLLPTVFVVSVGISCKRLQRKRITCTDSRGILVAGKVRKAFFDKTGTLTKQGLNFVSALEGEELNNLTASKNNAESSYIRQNEIDIELQIGLSVCHTLSLSADGELIGAAVDRMGFAAVPGSQLLDENTVIFDGEKIEYLKKFEFDHHTMTQSVIIRHDNQVTVYVKGAPEAIGKLCIPSSLPSHFEAKARQSARDGIYQLAMATAPFTVDKSMNDVTREDIQKELSFAGFINFQNAMKEDTPAVIQSLREGNVSSAMITGDNVLTGIYIAKQAGLIEPKKSVIIANHIRNDTIEWVNASDDSPAEPPSLSTLEYFCHDKALAMTGEVWNYLLKYDPKSALEYAKHTHVFGRTTPNDKVSIVSTFVEIGEITLMCGDGGNDCGALKAAHVGIALSDAEASVVAPFTSLDKTISSVTEVLKEGRCALASALAAYKYMIMYGQVESINQVVNAYLSITFTEWCWVFMDGIWTITMAFSLPLAEAAKKLSSKRPTASLLGPHTLMSACGILATNFLFLVIALLALWGQEWFQCRKWDSEDVSDVTTIGDNYETSVIFIVTGYQYISSAAAYNFGYTFRANWFRNYVFIFFFVLWTVFHFTATLTATKFSCIWRLNCDNQNAVRFVTSTEPEAIYNNFNTTVMPMSFRVVLLVLMIVNLIAICSWDYFVVNMALPKVGPKMGMAEDSQHVKSGEVTLEAELN